MLVFDTGKSRALPSLKLHGVLGCDAKPPRNVLADALAELAVYKNFSSVNVEIVEIKKTKQGFEARDGGNNIYLGRRIILATGAKDCFPAIERYPEAWEKGM